MDLQIHMDDEKLDGTDPIFVFEFHTRMIDECDTLSMTEPQAFMFLPKFISGAASGQYRPGRNSSRSSTGSITCWPEAIPYFLRTYNTPSEVLKAFIVLYATREKVGETELVFGTRLNLESYRRRNVHADLQWMNIFIYGLLRTTRTILPRYRESQPRNTMTYEVFVQSALEDGDAYVPGLPNVKSTVSPALPMLGPREAMRRSVHLLDTASTSENHEEATEGGELGLLEEGSDD